MDISERQSFFPSFGLSKYTFTNVYSKNAVVRRVKGNEFQKVQFILNLEWILLVY